MKRIIISVLLVAMLLSIAIAPVSAAAFPGGNTVQPMWVNTESIDVDLAFECNIGSAYTCVIAEPDASYIKTDFVIYEYAGDGEWDYVTSRSETVYDYVSGATCAFHATPGESYRIDFTFTINRNGYNEVIPRTIYGTYD